MVPQRGDDPLSGQLTNLTLILGGARSGKSRQAEALLRAEPAPWAYVATGQAFDEEMAERIRHHQARRGEGWITIEEPIDLAGAIGGLRSGMPVLVDCLTLWLSNLILAGEDIEAATVALEEAIARHSAPVVLVSNEVGLGIVPENALARRFRDEQGRLNQVMARRARAVLFMVAGLPITVK